jgi:hypothetical protein
MATLRRERTDRMGRRNRNLKIGKDLKRAEKLMERFGLTPETRTVDQGRSQEIQDILDQRKANVERAQQRDPEMERMLEVMRGGLGGLTAQENTMMRERGEQGMETSLQTSLRSLAGLQGRSGVRGAAAQAGAMDLLAERLMKQKELERDLQLENINVQDRRRAGYGDLLSNVLGTEFNQRQSTLNALEGSTGLARTDELNREMFNIQQGESADALRNSTLFGLVGLRGGRRATKDALELERERLEVERENAKMAQEAIMAQIAAFSGM